MLATTPSPGSRQRAREGGREGEGEGISKEGHERGKSGEGVSKPSEEGWGEERDKGREARCH